MAFEQFSHDELRHLTGMLVFTAIFVGAAIWIVLPFWAFVLRRKLPGNKMNTSGRQLAFRLAGFVIFAAVCHFNWPEVWGGFANDSVRWNDRHAVLWGQTKDEVFRITEAMMIGSVFLPLGFFIHYPIDLLVKWTSANRPHSPLILNAPPLTVARKRTRMAGMILLGGFAPILALHAVHYYDYWYKNTAWQPIRFVWGNDVWDKLVLVGVALIIGLVTVKFVKELLDSHRLKFNPLRYSARDSWIVAAGAVAIEMVWFVSVIEF